MILGGDKLTGMSTFKVDIYNTNGTFRNSYTFPKEEPPLSIYFYTDNEAIAAFKQYHGVKHIHEGRMKNLRNEDVLAYFISDDGTKFQFTRAGFKPFLDPKDRK